MDTYPHLKFGQKRKAEQPFPLVATFDNAVEHVMNQQSNSQTANKILKRFGYQLPNVENMRRDQKKYGWTSDQIKGIMNGTVSKLESTKREDGIPILYSQKSMMQLINNDTQRIESQKQVVDEFREMDQKSVFVLTRQLQFKNFFEKLQEELDD